ncbi:DarT ssDNA thymidine ADP-ribosyltransferase family protein [Sulfitobacter aestuariivivens]|uniref:DarT ssDNA thymidine ADP-ribosyltransferase family protein n=1 Tax=Sulfitobacter aestuariivivens TaxID=2766981 RepID=UPI003611FD7F
MAPAPSGNQWSWDADDHKGVSNYVSLCLTMNHPMKFAALKEERISKPRYLGIQPEVLLRDGVLFSADIANKADVALRPLDEALAEIDEQVIYTRTDWRDPQVKARLDAAERYEILVPKRVPLGLISRVF